MEQKFCQSCGMPYFFSLPFSGLCRAGEVNRKILEVTFNGFDADAKCIALGKRMYPPEFRDKL